jgi:hypothetical protein
MTNSLPSESSNLNAERPRGFKKILQSLAPVDSLDKAPDLILESFPRSGNTFMHIALRLSWPDMIIKSHSHDPRDIQNAGKDIPIVSMVRKPEDAIVSWTVFANAKENLSHFRDIENSIGAYRKSITAVIENSNVFVIPFQKAVANVNEVLDLTTSSIKNNNKMLISGRFLNNCINMFNTIKSGLLIIEPFYDAKKDKLPVEKDNFDRLNNKYGVSAFFPIQGSEHNDNYISNRLLEVITNGYVGFSNNILVERLFKNVYYNSNISELIKYISNLLNNKDEYCHLLDKQLDEIITGYYGYKIIDQLLYFLQKIVLKNNNCFSFNTYIDGKIYNLFFTNRILKKYEIINSVDLLEKVNTIKNNYIISENLYDVFMLDKITMKIDYNILIDYDYKYKELLINLCVKHKKSYTVKEPIKIYCLFSHQRTGSTLIIDYIQKTSKKVLALSEVINDTYITSSYDVNNQNGILYKSKLFELKKDASNIKEYINQFIDIAEEKGYEALVFKYTFNVINYFDTSNMERLIKEFKNYNIIYLDRNDIDIYISKKLADKNNTYSNKIYGNILGKDDFNNDKFILYLQNKHRFLKDFLSKLNNIKYINYNFIKENDHKHNITYINNFLNSFYSTDIEYLKYEKYYDYYNIFNKKQNKFENKQIINSIIY